MLPVPFSKYIPQVMADNPDAALTAMMSKADIHIPEWFNEILELNFLKIPERVIGRYLPELADYLGVKLFTWDTELVKRIKIQTAANRFRLRSTWAADTKLIIDALTGYDARIYKIALSDQDDAILLAKEASDPDTYWMTLSPKDGVDPLLGWYLVGDWTEYVIAGNVLIDCHYGVYTAVLTATQISQIVVSIKDDIVPVYYKIYLGYVNSSGLFTVYIGGII